MVKKSKKESKCKKDYITELMINNFKDIPDLEEFSFKCKGSNKLIKITRKDIEEAKKEKAKLKKKKVNKAFDITFDLMDTLL